MSWAARGLLIFLLTKPDNWRISPAHLVAETKSAIGKKSGRDNVYSLLNELICAGYISRKEIRDESGKIDELDYIISETKINGGVVVASEASTIEKAKPLKPRKDSKNNINQSIAIDDPITEKPYTANPDTANPTLTKNEIKQRTKKELLPTQPVDASSIKPVMRSSFSFDPSLLEVESGVLDKTESKAVKEYLARALDDAGLAQVVLDEVTGKIRAGKAAGNDKPIKTVVGYTTSIVSRLLRGGFVESHSIAERTRREKIAEIEKSKQAFVNSLPPCPIALESTVVLTERTIDEKALTMASRAEIFNVLGMRVKVAGACGVI